MAIAVLGGGCFWCLEAVFLRLRGVCEVTSGYCGGAIAEPDYESVCTGSTGHAEVVRIDFDPAVISYPEILRIFFHVHDPTTSNRQGNDVGTQYRSAIFVVDEDQRREALEILAECANWYSMPVVTEVQLLDKFYPAEPYHQRYFENNPGQGYCAYVVAPKVDKFRRQFAELLKADA